MDEKERKQLINRLKEIKILRKIAYDKDTHEGYHEYTELKWEERNIKLRLHL